MPNTISQQDLEDLHLPEPSPSLKLLRAGWIRPLASRGTCSAKKRMEDNADTINEILRNQDGRNPNPKQWLKNLALGIGDRFKKQAPGVIRAGQSIEVWATTLSTPRACQNVTGRKNSRCPACNAVEATLNSRYQTIQYGWAHRLS